MTFDKIALCQSAISHHFTGARFVKKYNLYLWFRATASKLKPYSWSVKKSEVLKKSFFFYFPYFQSVLLADNNQALIRLLEFKAICFSVLKMRLLQIEEFGLI